MIFLSFQTLNTEVIFYAQKTFGSTPDDRNDLIFDQVETIGPDGFADSTGQFFAPVSGLYRFTFSGTCNAYIVAIGVYKNGLDYLVISDDNEGDKEINISYTWMMKLAQSEEVRLKTITDLDVTPGSPLIFTGELIHID